MKNILHLSRAVQIGATVRGNSFDRVTMQAPFTGTFDAEAIHKAVSPDYSGCLYRPVSVDFYSVREVSKTATGGVVEWVRVLSNGD